MKKYTEEIHNKARLEQLLQQRKAPLSQQGLEQVLQELTVFMTSDVVFFGAIFPKKENIQECNEIEKADMMVGSDEERYFPVFSSLEKLKAFKPTLQDGEEIYLFEKKDLLSFLQYNQNLAAVVLNPQEDDLLLHRLLLQNLIQVESDNRN